MRGELNLSDFQRPAGQRNHLDGCSFRFYLGHKLNKEKTQDAGYPQHEPIEYIEITSYLGERTPRPVEERDKRAAPEAYARFQASMQKPEKGMWLVEWCILQSHQLADLLGCGLVTVEQVADLPKEVLEKNQHLIEYQRKADAWLTSAKSKPAEIAKLKEQLFTLTTEHKKLEEQYYLALQRISATEGNGFHA
jgi:hypothetical protein